MLRQALSLLGLTPRLHNLLSHPTLHPLEPLQDPHNRVRHLRQRKLLPDANPRSAVERQVLPRPRRPALPPARREDGRIGEVGGSGRVKVARRLHYLRAVRYRRAFWNADGRETVWAAADGECGVTQGDADVKGDDGVQT